MPFLRIWFATRFQRHHPIENIRSRQLVSYPCILLSMIQLPENTSKTLMFRAKALRHRLPNYSAAMSLKMNLQFATNVILNFFLPFVPYTTFCFKMEDFLFGLDFVQ